MLNPEISHNLFGKVTEISSTTDSAKKIESSFNDHEVFSFSTTRRKNFYFLFPLKA